MSSSLLNALLSVFLPIVLFSMLSCGKPKTPPRLEGAWLGEGMFSAGAGELAVKAQLEILSDGSYRFLILEPRLLALVGVESGKWSQNGERLRLEPSNEKRDATGASGSVLGKLRHSSPEKLRVKELIIAADLSRLDLADGPLRLKFEPNPNATQNLEEAGELE